MRKQKPWCVMSDVLAAPAMRRRNAFLGLMIAAFLLSPLLRAQTAERELTLREAIDLSLQHNRELQLARLEVKESEARKAIARSFYFPSIKNESSILHVTELAGIEIPAGAFGNSTATGLIPPKNLFLGQGGETSYTSGTGLTQPITQILRIRESNRAAGSDVKTSELRLQDAENVIALKVRQVYFSILIAQATQQAASLQVSANSTKDAEARQSVADGKALEVSALETRATLLDAQHSVLSQKLTIRDLILNLNDLTGLPLNTSLQLSGEASDYSITLPLRQEALQQAAADNSQVRQAEQSLEKAKAGYSAAREKYIPDVSGLARYSYQSGIPFLVHNFGTFGVSLSYDLFDGGKRRAEIYEAHTKLSQAEVNLAKVRDATAIQIETAYDKLEELQSLVGIAQEAYQTRQELARVTNEQFIRNAALASARDDALARVNQAKASLFEATLGQALAQADVLRLVGKLPR